MPSFDAHEPAERPPAKPGRKSRCSGDAENWRRQVELDVEMRRQTIALIRFYDAMRRLR